MSQRPPKPQQSVSAQTSTVQGQVSALGTIQSAIAAGTIDQGRVNSIVASVIAAIRAGE